MSTSRRASEDSRFRVFLSSHFDAQTYVTNIIKEGRSEEGFNEISSYIQEVDEEIKTYITMHKHDLMSGMHDVAVLTKRYNDLHESSLKLKRVVQKLQKDALSSHDVVKSRTTELERIHHTSVILRQLRQFIHAKSQLDHYSKFDPKVSASQDLRQFATIAKTINELETLLVIPVFNTLGYVVNQQNQIKSFGQQIRLITQEKLLNALNDHNQAGVADCLQVFYNLNSLPEIIVLAIDTVAKGVVDHSMGILDMQQMLDKLLDTGSNPKKGSLSSAGSNASSQQQYIESINFVGNISQLRIGMREMSLMWSNMLQEHAMKIHVLQRVVSKKTDPSSHERFIDVLKRVEGNTNKLLSNGLLLDLYWQRLSSSLKDVVMDKVKAFVNLAARLYPNLRRSLVEVYSSLTGISNKDGMTSTHTQYCSGDILSVLKSRHVEETENSSSEDQNKMRFLLDITDSANGNFGMFHDSNLDVWCYSSATETSLNPSIEHRGTNSYSNYRKDSNSSDENSAATEQSELETIVLSCLGPMKDRYMANVLTRMNAPVLQMFPELEGYTAAVPSKRDLQTLISAIQDEIVGVIIEGDFTIVRMICKEALKAIRLLVTKVENMIVTTSDASRIVTQNNIFIRNNLQEHNTLLLTLLSQLRESVQKLVPQILKATKDTPMSAIGRTSSSSTGTQGVTGFASSIHTNPEYLLRREMHDFEYEAVLMVDDLAGKQILSNLVNSISSYVCNIFLGLLKEGIYGTTTRQSQANISNISAGSAGSTSSNSTSSKTVELALKTIPDLISVYLQHFPHIPPVNHAIHEVASRILVSYISIAALRRPVNEQTRLITASEMSALDMLISGLLAQFPLSVYPSPTYPQDVQKQVVQESVIMQEFKAFRRLLFATDITHHVDFSSSSKESDFVLGENMSIYPSCSKILKLPYFSCLRPSTLLGYLIACGPPQLPSPLDQGHANSTTPHSTVNTVDTAMQYVDVVTSVGEVKENGTMQTPNHHSHSHNHANTHLILSKTVASLYLSNRNNSSAHWTEIPAEKHALETIQHCLDIFAQRAAVAEENQKKIYRKWYEALSEILSHVLM